MCRVPVSRTSAGLPKRRRAARRASSCVHAGGEVFGDLAIEVEPEFVVELRRRTTAEKHGEFHGDEIEESHWLGPNLQDPGLKIEIFHPANEDLFAGTPDLGHPALSY